MEMTMETFGNSEGLCFLFESVKMKEKVAGE
ncbi:hypothetical protein H4683_002367 [Filibacter limicola]|uniref:Uncharacterized protein n=1 Tax=Sporosarcina limicola TaxID=34101 RepID=A0A927MLC9_9BACL|nr:hypothetical protein [Sporosarcina limicola]